MRSFCASDGVGIAYRDEGAGRPLILLHGLMANGEFFKHQQALANRFRVITIDLRGHGQSARSGGRPTLARLAQDVSELISSLDLSGAIGVGWSLGASLLWRLLATGPADLFDGVVIVDMTPRVMNGPDWALGLSALHCAQRAAAIAADFPAFAAAAGAAIFADADDRSRDDAGWAARAFQDNDPAAIGALWNDLVEEDFRPDLAAIRQPALIVHGAHSSLYKSETADYLAAAMPHSRRIQFDRSGHAPHMEQPDLFNQIVTDFAASLPRIIEPQTAE